MLKYMEIYEWLKRQIMDGELRVGEKIYSENELIEMYSVSRQTVRHAISKLEYDGIVERKRGSGTFVREKWFKGKPTANMQIALICTYIDEYIFPRIISEIEKVVSREGYTLRITSTHNSIEKERQILRSILIDDSVDGLIVEATKSALPNPNIGLYKKLVEKGHPIVFLNTYYPSIQMPHISMNDKAAGKMATKYLIEKGHQKIGAIFKSDDGQGHLRYEGYIEALLEAKIPVREDQVIWIDTYDRRHMLEEADRYIRRLGENTAYVCYNDKVAREIIQILKGYQVKVPDDISLIGIDDSEIAENPDIMLTTVKNPVRNLGELSARTIIDMVRGSTIERSVELMPVIIERNSVAPCDKQHINSII